MSHPTDVSTAPPPIDDRLARLIFADLEDELTVTRRILERYPEEHGDWQPHEKSMSLCRLATHVAELPSFTQIILATEEWDGARTPYTTPRVETGAEILALFDRVAAELRDTVAAFDPAKLDDHWVLRRGDHVFVQGSRAALVRRMGLTHLAHHRGQLSVYYRLLGVPVPGMHGPSADEL